MKTICQSHYLVLISGIIAANAAGARIILRDAVLEVEVLDSVSGKRLGG